jgi:UDP-N-acetylmuramate dehydrogenase
VQNIGAYGVEAKDIIDTVHAFDLVTRTFVDIPGADCAYGYRTSRFKTDWKGRYIITAVTFRLSTIPQPKLDYGGVRKALEARFPVKPGMTEEVVMPDLIGHLSPQVVRETVIAIREQKLPDPAKVGSAGSFFCNPVIDRAHFERIVALAKEENGADYEVPHYDVGDRVKVPAAWMIDQCGFKGMQLGGAQVYPKQPLVIVNATGEASPEEIIALERRVIDTIRDKYGIELHPEVEHV